MADLFKQLTRASGQSRVPDCKYESSRGAPHSARAKLKELDRDLETEAEDLEYDRFCLDVGC
jgi:hypothetical protein